MASIKPSKVQTDFQQLTQQLNGKICRDSGERKEEREVDEERESCSSSLDETEQATAGNLSSFIHCGLRT